MARMVDSPAAAAQLADAILDPARERIVVCVTIPAWASEPLLDVDSLERGLNGSADLWVMPTGDLSWELSYRLPKGLDVYGGAIRVWPPGVDEESDRRSHPLFFVHDRSESAGVIERILATVEQMAGNGQGPGAEEASVPAEGSEHAAVVTRVVTTGAELELADGTPAFAHQSHLTSQRELAPSQVVRVGQAVRVRVSSSAGRRRVRVTLLPFEPDPWDRLAEAYPPGTVMEAVVTELRNIGAFMRLLPGVIGLAYKTQLSDGWIAHPEDVLALGERTIVRILSVNRAERKVALSRLDIPPDAKPVVASLYPDGPPWLPPRHEMPAKLRVGAARPIILPRPGGAAAGEVASEANVGAAAAPIPARADAAQPEARTARVEALAEADRLERIVARAAESQGQIRALMSDTERQLARLRGEAAELRRTLERDLGEVRRRILDLVESESSQLLGSTQSALELARAECAQLREMLAAAEEDRAQLVESQRRAAQRAERAERAVQQAQDALSREREVRAALQERLDRFGPDEETVLRQQIRDAWERATTADDRERYPWRDPIVGPDFVPSLDRVQGISRDRVIEVCAEVICGRAPERAGFEVHPLRVSEAGNSPQRVRPDGTKAYRVSLQVNSPSARRLHYWQLPDGRVELARVVYHDDYSI